MERLDAVLVSREQMRQQVWLSALAAARQTVLTTEIAVIEADEALAAFDERFGGEDGEPDE